LLQREKETVQELIKRKYIVLAFQKDEEGNVTYPKEKFNIVVERFMHMWLLLKQYRGNYRYIITTDVKDVVFQSDPTKWLEKNIGDKKIVAACESIRYKDEPWGRNNLQKSFGGAIYDENKDNLIVNAGTLSGDFDTMLDFFLNVFMFCSGTSHWVEGGGGPDQAAVNVLLNMAPYKDLVRVVMSEEGYAAQLGTTGPQVNFPVVEEKPLFSDSGLVTTSHGVPFAIVHQYDRVHFWRNQIEALYV
jgi:hypothetical protein